MSLPAQAPRLVIFGCGYVGEAVARAALARGWSVAALTRNPGKAEHLRGLGLHPVVEAELDSESWHAALEPQADYALNAVSSAGGGLGGYEKSYLRGQESILRWAASGHLGSFVYTSSTSVYPQSDGQSVTEDSPVGGSAEADILLAAEARLQGPPTGLGRAFVLRLSGIYGPGRHYLLDALRRGDSSLSGSGEVHLNLIHRDDIVAAIFTAFAAPADIRGGLFNLSDGQPAPKAEVVAWLADKLGCPRPRFDPAALAGRSGLRGRADRRVDSSRARQVLGWSPRFPDFKAGYEAILRG